MKLEDFLEELEFLINQHDKEVNPYRKKTPENSPTNKDNNLFDGLANLAEDLKDNIPNPLAFNKKEEVTEEVRKSYNAFKFNLDHMPYVKFLEYYKQKPDWERHIQNVDSPFMKLLQLDNLFFIKKILKMEKGDQPNKTILDYAAPQGLNLNDSYNNMSIGGEFKLN